MVFRVPRTINLKPRHTCERLVLSIGRPVKEEGNQVSRPAARGGMRGWSLMQIAAEANLTRGVIRSAQAKGFFGTPLQTGDIVVAQVAQVCLQFPDSETSIGYLGPRDRLAVHLTRALLTQQQVPSNTALALTTRTAELVSLEPPSAPLYPPPEALWRLWETNQSSPLVIAPVGLWVAQKPVLSPRIELRSIPTLAEDAEDPFGDNPL